jgi:Subtilase family.
MPFKYLRKEVWYDNDLGYSTYGSDLSGTSLAAPMVAGIIASLHELSNDLRYNPPLCRAIMMASATRTVMGDSRDGTAGHWYLHQGAGTVNAQIAYDTVINGRYAFGRWSAANQFPKMYSVSLSEGQTLRTVLAWNSYAWYTDPDNYSDSLDNKLDMELLDVNGDELDISASVDNSVEICEYTAPSAMTITIRLVSSQYTRPEWFGFAWTIR